MAKTQYDEYIKLSKQTLRKRQDDAVKWFLGKVGESKKRKIEPTDLLKRRRDVTSPLIGQMMFFEYDAKHKDTLPYWDRYPLAIIIDIKEDRFLSLNLHYLPYALRVQLIHYLLQTVTDNKLDHRSKARINYAILKTVSKYRIAKPAIKSHLFSHIRTKVVRIRADEWTKAIYLPVDRFQKAGRQKVWADSVRSIR